MGKIIAARKEGKEEAGNAARKENEEGLHSTPPVRVRASRQQGQLPRRSRHPVRHSGRLSLSADNVLTSSFFFQNYSFQRGGSAERAGAAETKTLASSHSHGFQINGVYQETLPYSMRTHIISLFPSAGI